MITLVLEELDSYIEELQRRVNELEKADIFVGYDQILSGKHYSGFTYVDLVSYLSNGNSSENLPPRPIFDFAYDAYNPYLQGGVKKNLQDYLSGIDKKKSKQAIGKIGNEFAQGFMTEMDKIFGNANILAPNSEFTQRLKLAAGITDPNQPLVFEGDLQANLGYFYNSQLQYTNKG